VFFLTPSFLKAQDCTPLDPRQQISEKTAQDISGAAQTVFKVGRVEGNYKGVAEKEVKNLYDKYPEADKIVLKDKLIYMFCTILQKSDYNTEKKLKEFDKFMTAIQERGSLPTEGNIPIAGGDKVTLGPLVYKLLSVQRKNPVPGKLSLLVTIRLTTQDKRALFSQDSFRLLVDNVPIAPEKNPKLYERVPSNSAKEGTIQFDIPDTVTDVKLLIISPRPYKEERQMIPIDLRTVKP
jgi:hypothetical protein